MGDKTKEEGHVNVERYIKSNRLRRTKFCIHHKRLWRTKVPSPYNGNYVATIRTSSPMEFKMPERNHKSGSQWPQREANKAQNRYPNPTKFEA